MHCSGPAQRPVREVCLPLTGPRTRGYGCAELTSTWVVDALALKTPEGSLHIVFAGLPCGVADAELRRGDEPLDATPTTARDDVTYVVLETPGTLTGVELVALGRTGDELFRVDRLDDDPSSRIPTQGC